MSKSRLRPIVILLGAALCSCVTNDQILRSGKETPTPENPGASSPAQMSSIDREIQAMRDANFRFVWIVRRKDGGQMAADDKAILRANTAEMNRRVLSDDGQAVIIGSNVVPVKENVDAIFGRFAVEDLSTEPMPSPLPTREKTPKPLKAAS